ncbi:MAG: helicase HerA domain-containing protein, partial [Fretibacterium sp.]
GVLEMEETSSKDMIRDTLAAIPSPRELWAKASPAMRAVDDIILKNYLAGLEKLEVVPLDPKIVRDNLTENVRFFKIVEMVYGKDECATDKFSSVFNALSNVKSTVFILIEGSGESTVFYMGVRSREEERTIHSLKESLKKTLSGHFPGIRIHDEFYDNDMKEVVSRVEAGYISSVSCIANAKGEEHASNKNFIQGLEKLALSLQGERYTALILATSVPQDKRVAIRREYERIYTHLSSFASAQVSYAANSSLSLSDTESRALTKGTSETTSNSVTDGTSSTTSVGKGTSVGAGLSFSSSVGLPLGGILVSAGTALSLLASEFQSESTSQGTSHSRTSGVSSGTSESATEGQARTTGRQAGMSQNITLTRQDKAIADILDRLDIQLRRMRDFESLGMWECAAYFTSDTPHVAELAAASYKALMSGESSGIETSAINSWSRRADRQKAERLREYLTNFIHPVFVYPSPIGDLPVTPCTFVSGDELALHMGLPRRSVPGLPVIEHAEFGREVAAYGGVQPQHALNLGNIFNMGAVSENRVLLDRDSLSMHTFITGSTGSGKSNAIYELLRQLDVLDVKFMVIEPAKGEYKQVFGNRKDVTVLGTNPRFGPLLELNPFKFPQAIHVLEHIDRLLEVFNVCWPMYAAMPAVLKDALSLAYESCGWDLTESKNSVAEDLFPTFADLQDSLSDVIESSAYAQEVKSNYLGALGTRVRSLSNGLNGQIFSPYETDNATLFDSNVVIDLSRVGSMETKALIMGLLVIRLSEHRTAFTNGMNVPLRHVTVLEEAHNILKRGSSEQGAEGPGLVGKSVEMLANSIAEMRTYGEGFVIADQSPGAVDSAAIRNTNTKIILRLPDESDRALAGKSAALKNEQLDEIAKLPRGVAVVYQNDWLEPVLCKIKKFDAPTAPYSFKPAESERKSISSAWLNFLLKERLSLHAEPDIASLKDNLRQAPLSARLKMKLHPLLTEYERSGRLKIWDEGRFAELAQIVADLTCKQHELRRLFHTVQSFDELNDALLHEIDGTFPVLSDAMRLSVCQCCLKNCAFDERGERIYAVWREKVAERGESF